MATTTTPGAIRAQLGYARVSTGHQSLDQQVDALTSAGVEANRVYSDKLSGTSTREQRPGLAALLDYAREGDAIVVVGIDRLGRNAAEVMTPSVSLVSAGSCFGRCVRASIRRTRRVGWWRAFWRAWQSLNWSWVASVARLHGKRGGRVGSRLGGLRRLMRRKLRWHNGCIQAVNRPAPSRPRWV